MTKTKHERSFVSDVSVALIGALVLVAGYIYNGYLERQQQIFQLKSEAYTNFLREIEKTIPAADGVLKDNDKIRTMNTARTVLTSYAPNKVIGQLNNLIETNKNYIGRKEIAGIRAILHNDLYYRWYSSGELVSDDFPFLPFQNSENK